MPILSDECQLDLSVPVGSEKCFVEEGKMPI
jgi:hypothetical protein